MHSKISIITVVFNDHNKIEKTICSVLEQDYSNLEYIIIDGNSNDGTIDVINKYIDRIDVFCTEDDNGIYDAMNKGIQLASGDWILFMNSGDNFYSNQAVSNIFNEEIDNDIDAILGSAYVQSYWGNFYLKVESKNRIWKRFVHQSLFTRKKLNLIYPFDLTYKSAADYNFVYKCFVNGYKFQTIDTPISLVEYNVDSYSAINEVTSKKEVVRTILQNLTFSGFCIHYWYHSFAVLRTLMSRMLRILLPDLVNFIRKHRDKIQ